MTDQMTLVANARGMFQFIRAMKQASSSKPPLRVSEYAKKPGIALDLFAMPDEMPYPMTDHARVSIFFSGDDSPAEVLASAILEVPRGRVSKPPALPDLIRQFVHEGLDDPNRQPVLEQALLDTAEGVSIEPGVLAKLGQIPAEVVVAAFDQYLDQWGRWADEEQASLHVRNLYLDLFQAYENARSEPQSWEFLLGVARLKRPPGAYPEAVDRPLLVAPLKAEVSGRTGGLAISLDRGSRFRLEADLVRAGELASADAVRELETALALTPAGEFELPDLTERIRFFVNKGLRDVRLVTDAEWSTEDDAVVALRPMIIARRRGSEALIRALDSVVAQLQSADHLPRGLAALVDPAAQVEPGIEMVVPDGGVVFHRGEPITPKPLNERQWDVLRRTDSRPLALVQGPPGTGKTHTTAALISHLLAQGKRILVTAAKTEALKEVREKLPEQIRSLAVARLDDSEKASNQLRGAIEELSRRATEFDDRANQAAIARAQARIETYLERKDQFVHNLVAARKAESEKTETPFGQIALSELVVRWAEGRNKYGWALDVFREADPEGQPPPSARLRSLDAELADCAADPAAAEEARLLDGVAEVLPSESAIATAMADLQRSEATLASLTDRVDQRVLLLLRELSTSELHAIDAAVRSVSGAAHVMAARPEGWIRGALADVAFGRVSAWRNRESEISQRIAEARQLYESVRGHEPIRTPSHDYPALAAATRSLVDWTSRNGDFVIGPAGRPRFTLRTPRSVRHAWTVIDGATLRGRVPASSLDLEALLSWFVLHDRLHDLDEAWPAGFEVISREESPAERMAWHEDELNVLREVLRFPQLTRVAEAHMAKAHGLPAVDWTDPAAGHWVLDAVAVALAERDQGGARAVLDAASAQLMQLGTTPSIARALDGINRLDGDGFRLGLQRTRDRYALRDRLRAADAEQAELSRSWPRLTELLPTAADSRWRDRIDGLDDAWNWWRIDRWLLQHRSGDPNMVFKQIADVDALATKEVAELAALRAWGKAVSRLNEGGRKADLQAYVDLMGKLGKGTGKYAARIQSDIQKVLVRASSSVPVWITPFSSVVETMAMAPESFDVVIVDEASQLGLEGVLLAYLAPRMVVVGDDKQVSPDVSKGLDQGRLIPLREQFLAWNPQNAVYNNYDRSLFVEAKMRFPDVITLIEHRRCVPDIINFSTEIAYKPFNISLIPVKMLGSGALPPFITTFVEDGETTGTPGKVVNEQEAKALVEKLVEAMKDPRYQGLKSKDFGVISLQGSEQSVLIRSLMAEKLPSDVAVEIKVDEPPKFQGQERKVIFLSMVAAPRGRKTSVMAQEMYVQRFNVAVSRAIDQIHLVHSVRPADLPGKGEDLRYRLLQYIEKVGEPAPRTPSAPVPPDEEDPRFANQLEQDVYNLLASRDYQVIPQYSAPGGSIDLVVVGEKGKAGIICLDEKWAGEDRYREQLRFESELLRLEWPLFRVRKTAMVVDPEGVAADLVSFLSAADVHPVPPEPTGNDSGAAGEQDDEQAGDGEEGSDTVTDVRDEDRPGEDDDDETGGEEDEETGGDDEDADDDETGGGGGILHAGLAPYNMWVHRPVASVSQSSSKSLQSVLLEIVEAEGPILGELLYRRYIRASGAARLGGQIKSELNKATAALVRARRVAQLNDGVRGQMLKTLYIPGTPQVVLREAGRRDLEGEVPRSEVKALLEHFGMVGGEPTETVMRQVLEVYGLTGLTKQKIAFLNECAAYRWE